MGMVAEGLHTAQAVYELAERHNLDMPIATAVYTILFGDAPPQQILKRLVTEPADREVWLPDTAQETATIG